MSDINNSLRIVLIAALLPAFVAAEGSSDPHIQTDRTLEAIRECMDCSQNLWSDEWNREFLETIRKTVEAHQDTSNYIERLEILKNGFATCWESYTKNKDRALFEVYRCRTCWYVENLMGTDFPSDKERHKLRDQFTEIWNHAADSLLKQFRE